MVDSLIGLEIASSGTFELEVRFLQICARRERPPCSFMITRALHGTVGCHAGGDCPIFVSTDFSSIRRSEDGMNRNNKEIFLGPLAPKRSARVLFVGIAALLSAACSGETDGSTSQRTQALVQQLPARIEAEDFERFQDSDTINQGNCGTGPVDREQTQDLGGGCNVGWTAAGEWLEYDVYVGQTSSFDLVLRVASAQAGRTARVEIDGQNVSGSIVSPSSGWQSFEDRAVEGVPLSVGTHTVRVVFETGYLNLNYIDVVASQGPSGALIDTDFDSGTEGFAYADDMFRGTSAPNYANGTYQNGGLVVTLGGQDNSAIVGMSGGFSRSFTLSEPGSVSLELGYTIAQSCAYETDEQSEMLVAFDGSLVGRFGDVVDRVTGDGNDCPGQSSTGLFFHTVELSAGTHTLSIGGYNNKKTFSDEVTTAVIDRVLLTTESSCVTSSPALENLCTACGGSITCAGTCSTNIPQNIGAPCGSCGGVVQCDGTCSEPLSACDSAPTAAERLAACARDPRVVAGLVTPEVCAGADLFFRETFEGNGRTCGSCHPVANNYTIDPEFVSALHDTDPQNPLFVNEFIPELAQLETSDLVEHAAILENIDGFQDPQNRFVSRSVPHLFSLSQTITADPGDATTSPPVERTGWGGDGAPGDGSLNAFLEGAIIQHFPLSLARIEGVDFRPPTAQEADLVEEFQLSLGRLAELDLANAQLSDETAEIGRQAFLDPLRATCGTCHGNAGSNFSQTGLNRNFDNGIGSSLTKGTVNGSIMTDAGFGGADLDEPNADPIGLGVPSGFGNITFSPPSLIEAADTPPFFHSNSVFQNKNGPTLSDVVQFYGDGNFQNSSGKAEIDALFGPAEMLRSDLNAVVRLLHVLNAAFNIDLAMQRLQAVQILAQDLAEIRGDVQTELMVLAGEEIEDAIFVLSQVSLHPAIVDDLSNVLATVLAPASHSSASSRGGVSGSALVALTAARAGLGSNINLVLGTGTLMY